MSKPAEDLAFSVEAWSADRSRWDEVLARTCNITIAIAAFNAATTCRHSARILIRHGARVVRDSAEKN